MTNINQQIGQPERSFSSSVYPSKIEEAFWKFHRENPQVWVLFSRFTMQLIEQRGFKHYSADAVMHRVRWETHVETRDEFKINNNFIAHYARLFMQVHPNYQGFFRTREIKS